MADRRVFVIILCGAGDRPLDALDGGTPLEMAPTPHLDDLARRGATRLVEVIDEVIPPESDSGAMALLGFDPRLHYTGRGPLEALGSGFWPRSGQAVGFRINFASQDPNSLRLDRRTARDLSDEELRMLVDQIRDQVTLDRHPEIRYELTAFGRHRGILCFTSELAALSGWVSNTDPGFGRNAWFGIPVAAHANSPHACLPLDGSHGAANTAAVVNEFVRESAEVLGASEVNRRRLAAGQLPANVILVRDGGHELPGLTGFHERTGRGLVLYGQVPAERGLCMLLGGRFVESKPQPGQPDAAFYRELVAVVAGEQASLVLVHLKAADEPGHDGDHLGKLAALATIDRYFIGPLGDSLGPQDVVVVTGDHATPCEIGIHVADPVPTLVCGMGVPADDSTCFSEREAAAGGLPVTRAAELMSFLSDRAAVA